MEIYKKVSKSRLKAGRKCGKNVNNISAINITATINDSFGDELSQTISDSYPIDISQFTSLSSSTPKFSENTSLKKSITELQTDWRIGTKARIISDKPFPWMRDVSSTGVHQVKIPPDEITAAMLLSMNGYAERTEIAETSVQKTPLALLQAATMFYQSVGPSSKPVFPRLEGTFSNKSATKTAIENALIAEWTESFDHLFATWRAGQRDYFYACAYSFTILFTRASSKLENPTTKKGENCRRNSKGDSPLSATFSSTFSSLPTVPNSRSPSTSASSATAAATHKIVLTPTTLGLRELLTAEGINFTLPLRTSSKTFLDFALEAGDKDFLPADAWDEKEANEPDLDEDEWLKEIGISPKRFKRTVLTIDFSQATFDDSAFEDKPLSADVINPKVNVNKNAFADRKRSASTFFRSNSEDSSRSTIVIAEEASIDAFYRLLRSLKVGMSKNGLHAGLAPTLLAPSPFFGAIPKKLKLASHVTKKDGELKYVLELDDGPILPFVTKILIEFLCRVFPADGKENVGRGKSGVQIQVLGRLLYSGFNEAVDAQLAANINEFNFDLATKTFSL